MHHYVHLKGKLQDKTKLLACALYAYAGDPFLIVALLFLDSSPLIPPHPPRQCFSPLLHCCNTTLPVYCFLRLRHLWSTLLVALRPQTPVTKKKKSKENGQNKQVVLQQDLLCPCLPLWLHFKRNKKKINTQGESARGSCRYFYLHHLHCLRGPLMMDRRAVRWAALSQRKTDVSLHFSVAVKAPPEEF